MQRGTEASVTYLPYPVYPDYPVPDSGHDTPVALRYHYGTGLGRSRIVETASALDTPR